MPSSHFPAVILRRRRAIAAESVSTAVALSPRVPTFALTRPAASPNLETVSSWPWIGTPRAAALSIPTVATCRDLIVGAIVQMGVYRYRGVERTEPGRLITQPDPDTTWAAMLAGTVEDLIYDARAYWLVLAHDGIRTERNPRGLPVRARWIPTSAIAPELERDRGAYSRLKGYRVDGIRGLVDPELVIRFDSPLPSVLAKGATAIANALALEERAARLAAVELPAGVIENEGAELNEDEAQALIDAFESARREHTVAFLQHAKYTRTELNAEDLELVAARANAATEMARLHNVPVTMASASPSGGASAMLYSNLGSQLSLFVSNAVSPYLVAIEQTLSRDDVTPLGTRVAFDVAAFLRSDPEELKKYALELKTAGVIDAAEARAMLGIPSSSSGSAADLQPGSV
jgi:hypothetical protein